MKRTYSLEEVVAEIGAPSVHWLRKQIKDKGLPARKLGHAVRLTDDDIEALLEAFLITPNRAPVDTSGPGLTPTSARRRARRSA